MTLDPAGMYRVRTAVDHLIAEHEHAEQFPQAMEELSQDGPDGRPIITDPEERQRTVQRAGRLALASHHTLYAPETIQLGSTATRMPVRTDFKFCHATWSARPWWS